MGALHMRAQAHCSAGEETRFARCIILPFVSTMITFKVSNPEVKKNYAVHHSGELVIVSRLLCKMWMLYKYSLMIVEGISYYLLF